MKKKIMTLAATLALVTTQSFATGYTTASRKIEKLAPYDKIVVGENLNVLLVNDEEAITIEGNAAYLDYVNITSENGTLVINSNKKSTKERVVVYVPVKRLSTIQVIGESKIVSAEPINAPDLKVLLESDCELGLQTNGKVTIQYSEDFDLSFLNVKNPKLLKTEHLQ